MNIPTIIREPDEFKRWLTNAKLGEWMEYHRGFTLLVSTDGQNHDRGKVGTMAWKAYDDGFVELVQSRNPNGSLSYLAKRIAKRPLRQVS